MPDRDAFVVRTYRPGDETAILELFTSIFRHPRTLDEWEWRFRKAPSGPAEIIVLEADDDIVGHIAHVGFETFVDGRKLLVGHGGDTMVHPDMRERGGLRRIVEGFLASDHGFDARMGFPSDRAVELFKRYTGESLLGRLDRCIRWRRPISLVHARRRRLKPHLLGRDVALWLRPRLSRVREKYRIEILDHLGEEVDSLAEQCAQQVGCMRVRDAAYMTWRWLEEPNTDWRVLAASDADANLSGLIVFGIDNRNPRYRFPAGHVVDMLAVDAPTTSALLSSAAQSLFERGCTNVVYEHHDPRPWSRSACHAAGFVREGQGHNVMSLSLSDKAGVIIEDLANWYLTKGDTDLA